MGNRRPLLTGFGDKAFEIFSNDLVEEGVLRFVASVFDGMIPERDRVRRAVYPRDYTILVQNMSRPLDSAKAGLSFEEFAAVDCTKRLYTSPASDEDDPIENAPGLSG